jgi:hypothetical protein
VTVEEEQEAERLLHNSRRYFTCPVLHVRMLKTECVLRQHREPQLSQGTRVRILLYNGPADHYCRSGECETGNKIAKQLKRRDTR